MALRFSPARGTASLVMNAMVRGPTGAAATISVGAIASLTPGATPTVTNTGTTAAAVFAFGIPTSKTVAAGTTTTGAEGTSATVADSGTSSASVFDFTIPRGASPAIGYTFSTTTTDSDPGAGIVRFNNATPASITAIYFDNADADGNTVTAWLDTFDDSTTSGNKGSLVFTDVTAPSTKIVFDVTGASVVDGTGYRKVTVTHNSGSTLFTNARRLAVVFARTGDKGADGAVAGPGTTVDGEVVLFNGTTGNVLKRASTTGILKGTSGVLGSAVSGTDYAPATSGSAILKGNGAGGFSSTTAGTDYMHPGTTSAITKGFTLTPYNGGTVSSGTYTPDAANGNYQYYTNNGAHTLANPTADCAIDILVTNGASAGAITFTTFTVASGNTGDALTTTNTNKFIISIRRINATSTYVIKALQ